MDICFYRVSMLLKTWIYQATKKDLICQKYSDFILDDRSVNLYLFLSPMGPISTVTYPVGLPRTQGYRDRTSDKKLFKAYIITA